MEDNENIMNADIDQEQDDQEQDQDQSSSNSNETKAEKFIRLAPPRVNKIIGAIQSLSKLSATGSYEYTPEQIEKMFTAIKNELNECEVAFQPKEEKKPTSFTF